MEALLDFGLPALRFGILSFGVLCLGFWDLDLVFRGASVGMSNRAYQRDFHCYDLDCVSIQYAMEM